MSSLPVCLTIAGSDSGGGAGIQVDNRTFEYFNCFPVNVLTAVTAQSHASVYDCFLLPPEQIAKQLELMLETYSPIAVKTGMLGSGEICKSIADLLKSRNTTLVIDPVIQSTSGKLLLSKDGLSILINELIPQARLLTPNTIELKQIFQLNTDDIRLQIEAIRSLNLAPAVLIKGGHAGLDKAMDFLIEGQKVTVFSSPYLQLPATVSHGTGCTLSAAITACLAHGRTLKESIREAKGYLFTCLENKQHLSATMTVAYPPSNGIMNKIEIMEFEEGMLNDC